MFFWRLMETYWNDTGPGAGTITLPGGSLTRAQITSSPDSAAKATKLVDDLLAMMRLTVTPTTLAALYQYATASSRWERINVMLLIFLMPELHTA